MTCAILQQDELYMCQFNFLNPLTAQIVTSSLGHSSKILISFEYLQQQLPYLPEKVIAVSVFCILFFVTCLGCIQHNPINITPPNIPKRD